MAGISIENTTVGYSSVGAANFLRDLNTKAIVETCQALDQYQGLLNAIQAGWQGKAEENFETNFMNFVNTTKSTIQGMEEQLNGQFANLEAVMKEQDEQMVQLED